MAKWFRFRAMCFEVSGGIMNQKIEIFAPNVKQLREKVANELEVRKVVVAHAEVDKVSIHIKNKLPVLDGVILSNAIDGIKFVKEARELLTCKK